MLLALRRRGRRGSGECAARHPDSYYSVSDRLAREIPGAFKPNQFANPNGPRAHYETTGPEIWRDTDGRVTHFVAGIGTGGTISGTGRFLKDATAGEAVIVGADPEGSIYSGGPIHSYAVEGVGEDFYPDTFDPSVVDRYERVSDAESFAMTRRLAREEGLLVGGSSGMAVVAALRVAQGLGEDDVVAVLLPDHGRGYLRGCTTTRGSTPVASSSTPTLSPTPSPKEHAHDQPHRPRVREPRRARRAGARRRHRRRHPAGAFLDDVCPRRHRRAARRYEYGRSGNPTRTALQAQLAAIEGGAHAFSFASGLAAEDTLLRAALAPGDEVLLGSDVYGGTYRLARVLGPWGVRLRVVDMSDLDAVRAAVETAPPQIVWVETPSNPLLRITDIAGLAEIGHAVGALVVVDNTFATPALQQPLALGADVVVHRPPNTSAGIPTSASGERSS